MKVEIKILVGLPDAVLPLRELRGKHASKCEGYRTNKLVKFIDTYLCLRSLTSTGIIQNYPSQIKEIAERCKIGITTLYDRIYGLQKMDLLEKNNRNLRLKSIQHLAEMYELDINNYLTVIYDTEEKKQPLEWHIRNCEFEDNVNNQNKGFERSFAANPKKDLILEYLKFNGFDMTCNNTLQQPSTDVATESNNNSNEVFSKLQHALQQLQIERFRNNGTKRNDFLYTINPFICRNVASIRKAHGLKSNKSVAYTKKQIVFRGFRPPFEAFKPVMSLDLSHLPDDVYSVKYANPKDQKDQTFWYMPNKIKPSPLITYKTQKTNTLTPKFKN